VSHLQSDGEVRPRVLAFVNVEGWPTTLEATVDVGYGNFNVFGDAFNEPAGLSGAGEQCG